MVKFVSKFLKLSNPLYLREQEGCIELVAFPEESTGHPVK